KTFILVECPFTEPHHTVREGDTLQTLTIIKIQEEEKTLAAIDMMQSKYGHEIEMYTVEQGEKRDKRQ
ncbi:hypothetical protein, partial [Alistipes putredinis]|uniref:hypothetical protein n=1 Tax=Alistipes putredinis TaxID=28117 RepID=UPI003A8917C5